MLTEFKRDNKQKDYERMSEDLNRRKRELKCYEDQLRARTGDILQMDQSQLDDKVCLLALKPATNHGGLVLLSL